MALAFLAGSAFLTYILSSERQNIASYELKKRAHKYSGADPKAYRWFAAQLRLAELRARDDPRTAARHLYEAIDSLQMIGVNNPSLSIEEQLNELSTEIGKAYEEHILQFAVKRKMWMRLRYLND